MMTKIGRISPRRVTGPIEVIERRFSPRVAVELEVRLRLVELDVAYGARVGNISNSGLFVCTESILSIGTTVDIEIAARGTILPARGVVIRQSGDAERFGMALRFDRLPARTRRFCDMLVEEHGGR
jgi:hypothetical protein